MSDEQVEALRSVLASDRSNHALRRALIDACVKAGRLEEACDEYLLLEEADQLDVAEALAATRTALRIQNGSQARRFLDRAKNLGATATADLDAELSMLREQVLAGPVERSPDDGFLDALTTVDFSIVGGLEDVKKAVNRMIVMPFRQPDLYARYGKRAGGGILLYGPPGCGKTLLARATAGEVGLPFFNLRIEDIVDPYFGVSEQRMADAFAAARQLTPCVLFIDEIDAIGYARARQRSERSRALVEVLLQQLDSVGVDNTNLLVLAATNEPWDVDGALLRPGRFDRRVFVPPPDRAARRAILQLNLDRVPHTGIDSGTWAKRTELFSGADLKHLVDLAVEEVLEEAIRSGTEPPLQDEHLQRAFPALKPSAVPWLSRARNHADFANVGGRYEELASYLKGRAVVKALRSATDNAI